MKIVEIFVAKDGRYFSNEQDCISYEKSLSTEEQPYIYKPFSFPHQEVEFNPNYPENATCECGHSYYRHFDSYENMDPVGCKYCGCGHFKLAKEPHQCNHD